MHLQFHLIIKNISDVRCCPGSDGAQPINWFSSQGSPDGRGMEYFGKLWIPTFFYIFPKTKSKIQLLFMKMPHLGGHISTEIYSKFAKPLIKIAGPKNIQHNDMSN